MKKLEQYQEEVNEGYPHLPGDEQARIAGHERKADDHKAAVDALCLASSDEQAARRLWERSFPRGNASSALWAARVKRFGSILVSHGLVTREQIREVEANYGNL